MTLRSRLHRAHHSKLGRAIVASALPLWVVVGIAPACGGFSLPRAPLAQVRPEAYVPVPFTPMPPPVEIIPPRPREAAVWIDGTWEWGGERYRWQPGGWVIVPPGLRRTRWVVVRRADGQLFFAAASWLDAQGKAAPGPEPLVRARSRASDTEIE